MKKILAILLTAAMCAGVSACAAISDSGTAGGNSNNATSTASTAGDIAATSKAPAEANTSAKVDEICLKAMDDVKTMSKDDATKVWDEGFAYFKAHSENLFESNEVMESVMYYGQFIYSYVEANATDMNNLKDSTKAAYDTGYNALIAVKYVYRGAEEIEDESTQKALAEFTENLAKFK